MMSNRSSNLMGSCNVHVHIQVRTSHHSPRQLDIVSVQIPYTTIACKDCVCLRVTEPGSTIDIGDTAGQLSGGNFMDVDTQGAVHRTHYTTPPPSPG